MFSFWFRTNVRGLTTKKKTDKKKLCASGQKSQSRAKNVTQKIDVQMKKWWHYIFPQNIW